MDQGLLYVPADDGLNLPWDAAGAIAALGEVVDADSMERRYFVTLTGLTLTATAHQWLFDPARVAASVQGKRVDHALVDNLERVAEARRRMDDAVGGGSLLPAVREDLRLVVALLKNSAYTEEIGRRLHAVAAEFGRLAGWLAYDSGQPAVAQRYHMAALRAAHVSGDRAVGANVLGFMSIQAAFSDNPKDAVVLAESALGGARALTPAVEASLHLRMAAGAAYAGDAATWQRAQDRTFDLPAGRCPRTSPPGSTCSPRRRHTVSLVRRCWRSGNPSRPRSSCGAQCPCSIPDSPAIEHHGSAGSPRPASMRARLSRRARPRARPPSSSGGWIPPRVQQRLAEFRRAANPYAGSAAVREFDAKYRDLLTTRPAST